MKNILQTAIHSYQISKYSRAYFMCDLTESLIFFHGEAVDERGTHAINTLSCLADSKNIFVYDVEKMCLNIDGTNYLIQDLFVNHSIFPKNSTFILDATTLGFVEIFLIIKILTQLKISAISILYIEPKGYTTEADNAEIYNLSLKASSFSPIPTAVIDMSSSEVPYGVFFLGYESSRISIALDSYSMISNKDIKVVFGVPAFTSGWELKSIIPHLEVLKENSDFNMKYCGANDPGSAYDILLDIEKLISNNEKFFIAPIGTKPCGIATAIFANVFSDRVGLLYDHPIKLKNRTYGVSTEILYKVHFKYD
ncbi:hypothetical protein [Acinetobacter parvus]|uniref:hypothetical protein n=1 Tax=Acinetobacter parvus TaxID=134533 RepID=UPI0021D2124F|nr:hypothetical protein [Acinetobacter parvus]MCU4394549.1 hypothetical protein [Acinetobacter parvus]